jgi:predicted secreted Zn-dependent protease
VTWHHVLIISIAAAMVLVCASRAECAPAFPGVVQLATMMISGALGHAGAKRFERKGPKDGDHR